MRLRLLKLTQKLLRRGETVRLPPLLHRSKAHFSSAIEWNAFHRQLWHNPHDASRAFGIPTRRFIHRIAGVSTRDMAEIEERVWSKVGETVKDPTIGISLKDLKWMNRRLAVSEDGDILVLLKVPTLLHPSIDQLKSDVADVVRAEIRAWGVERGQDSLDEVGVKVETLASAPTPYMADGSMDENEIESTLGPGLANVGHFLAVYSCKGGVGKSTIAANLAFEMARMGGRVGLLDLDVYGPSLPVLVKPDDQAVRQSPLGKGMVYPIEHEGVKMLSLGYVNANSGVPGSGCGGGAAVLRGPMAGKVVTQLLKGTDWGELDVLILDMPPGTGDVQLTLCQDIDLSGAVSVTTPSKLAIEDARKGIEMFSELGVPTLAVVENMSYFECDGGGKHYPFGRGFADFLKEESRLGDMNPENVCQFPISSAANDANETGTPLCLSRPEEASQELESFERLAKVISTELLMLPYKSRDSGSTVVFENNDEQFDLLSVQLSRDGEDFLVRAFSEEGALQQRFQPSELRKRDPKTGALLNPDGETEATTQAKPMVVKVHHSGPHSDDNQNVVQNVQKKARVGYEVTWGDRAKFIYSRRAIALAAGGEITR